MVSFYEALNLASLIYAIPAFFIYVVFLILLFHKRRGIYGSAFYDYIRLLGIVDLGVYITFYGVFRAGHFSVLYPIYDKFRTNNWFTTTFLYISVIFQNAQHLLHLFLALNRFCVFILPLKYHQYLKTVFKVSGVFSFIFPAIYLGWIPFAGSKVGSLSVPEGYPIQYAIENYKPWSYTPSKGKTFAIVGAVCYLISFAFNVITVLKLYLHRKNGYQKKQAADTKLFLISLLLFSLSIVHCIFYLFLTFNTSFDEYLMYFVIIPLQGITYDFACLFTPFCFMILSPSLRKNIFQVMLMRGDEATAVTIVAVTQTGRTWM